MTRGAAEELPEWVALQQALATMGRWPPCASDPDAWFPDKVTAGVDDTVGVCGRCPLASACAACAVAAREPEGVWGGTTPQDRRELAGAA